MTFSAKHDPEHGHNGDVAVNDHHHQNGHGAVRVEADIAVIDHEAMKYRLLKIEEEMDLDRALKAEHFWNTSRRPLCTRFVPRSLCGIVVRSLMLVLLAATMWGVVDSVFTAPVRYDLQGLVGWAITNPHRAYSPWQIVRGVPSHTDEHEAAPPLSLCLGLTIIVFPIALVVMMVAIWMLPLQFRCVSLFKLSWSVMVCHDLCCC